MMSVSRGGAQGGSLRTTTQGMELAPVRGTAPHPATRTEFLREAVNRSNTFLSKPMNTKFLFITLTWTACLSTAFAQTPLFKDDFSGPLSGWTTGGFPGDLAVANQQLVVSETSFGPQDTNNILAAFTDAQHWIPITGPLPVNQTLELRADLVRANHEDTLVSLHYFDGTGNGYVFGKSRNIVMFFKFWNGGLDNSGAVFFWEHGQLKNQNVTLALALARFESSLSITTRVLDKDNANAVLFERTVTDTPQADAVLPNRAPDGMLCYPDQLGTPWPILNAAGKIVLGMIWLDPTAGPQPAVQVTFDNAEAWQYESPQLTIQSAVVLSWPVTQGQFVVESATSVDGPWQPIAESWSRTKDGQVQVSILAPDSRKFFHLRLVP